MSLGESGEYNSKRPTHDSPSPRINDLSLKTRASFGNGKSAIMVALSLLALSVSLVITPPAPAQAANISAMNVIKLRRR